MGKRTGEQPHIVEKAAESVFFNDLMIQDTSGGAAHRTQTILIKAGNHILSTAALCSKTRHKKELPGHQSAQLLRIFGNRLRPPLLR